ncbi:tRNA 2-thiouridine(34) synthase MnmA [Candidatus Woesearchaeota archaeon]|nr:tRNA 2-thiouridine(34) synthase MnmA [Candidatus Woesearchaeota archaeon]
MKIAALVSGGVDSSVALALLKQKGYDVHAFYIRIWLEDKFSHLGECPWKEDLEFVKKTCEKLNVPFNTVDLQKEYWKEVVSYTISEIKKGRTPNPDMLCNQRIKFGAFFDAIKGYDKIATGHYAQVFEQDDEFILKKSPDPIKDQTYFLANLSQEQLSKAMFPIGHLTKKEVRALARKFDLPTKDRKDSQGICFLGKIKFKEFIKEHLGAKDGKIVEKETGTVWGTHKGYWYFTIGQREGLYLHGGPWYVIGKDVEKNIVYISKKKPSLGEGKDRFRVAEFNWIVEPSRGRLFVKLRHGPGGYNCVLEDNTVFIDGKDEGIAPGQFAVFYDGDICLGCAVIQ